MLLCCCTAVNETIEMNNLNVSGNVFFGIRAKFGLSKKMLYIHVVFRIKVEYQPVNIVSAMANEPELA